MSLKISRGDFAKTLSLLPFLGVPGFAAAARAADKSAYYTGDYKVALNFFSFSRTLNTKDGPTTFDIIDYAAKLGFDAVDIWAYFLPEYSDSALPSDEKTLLAYAAKIRQRCSALNLAICGTGIRTDFVNPDKAKREFDMLRAKYYLRVAQEMGSPILRVFSGPIPPGYLNRWSETEAWMADAFNRLADAAKPYGIKIGVQEHADSLSTASEIIDLVKKVNNPNFGIVVDTGEFQPHGAKNGIGYHWYEDIAQVMPYAINVAIKFKPGDVADTVFVDMPRLIRIIRESPYRGCLPIEYVARKDNTETWDPYKRVPVLLSMIRSALAQTKERYGAS